MPGARKKKNLNPYEYRWIRKSGEIVWFLETAGSAVHHGMPALQASVMDITRYKQSGVGGEDAKDRYRMILEEIDLGYGEMDLAGNLTFVNQAGARNIGYASEEIIGKNYRDFVTERAAKKLFEVYQSVYKTGQPVKGVEVEFLHRDKTARVKEMSAALIRDDQGKPTGFRGLSRDVTERKRLEETLRKSEERYRTILEDIEEGYGELDLDGNFTFVNDAAAKNIGYTPEEIIGTPVSRYMNAADAEKLLAFYSEIRRTGQPVRNLEVPFITKTGITRYVEVSGALIRDERGSAVGFRGVTRDVTERKWTEEALLQSEARYLSIIESVGEAYFETDLRGTIIFINDRVCVDLGYTRTELLQMSHWDIQDPANAKKTQEAFGQVYQTGQPNPAYHYEMIRKDGTKAVFEMSVSLMRDAEGKPVGFRGLSRDITKRRKMEDALKASEERARTIIATSPDPYYETDLKGKITYINQAFQSLTGYSLDELAQMDYRVYLDQQNAEAVYTLYHTVYKTGLTMKNAEIRILNRSGENRIVNLSVSLIRNPQDEPTGFHGILRDVTEKKMVEALIVESEKQQREYTETLERSVMERTAELEKAKVAAEAASRAKSDFLANISHEFQTPLNSIIGFTKVLKDRLFGELNDKQEEFIRYISDAGENLSRLLTEIIDVSNISTGRTRLNLSSVALPQALSKTVTLLGNQILDKKQILTVNVALDADVSIEADDEKVRHIFFHLLSNAVKYSPCGATITVDAQRTRNPAGADGVAVAVLDTGPGIKPADIPRLFQNFGRLESSYARENGGIGVGLSLTRQLAELHGGDISVESEYGCGSRFVVFLPLKQKHTEAKG
jgi:PAS domain S-box-containing protein